LEKLFERKRTQEERIGKKEVRRKGEKFAMPKNTGALFSTV